MNLRELIDKIFEQDDNMNLLNIINESFDKSNKKILKEAVDSSKVDENIFIKKPKVKSKSSRLKEAAKKIYKYLAIDHNGPDAYYLIKSDKKLDEIGDWIFTDVTDEHGKGYVIWNDEEIYFQPNKSPQELDKLVHDKLVDYMRDLEKRDSFDDLIEDGYLYAEDIGLEDDLFYFISGFDAEELIKDYNKDKTLRNYNHLISDIIENSQVDSDSGSAVDYIDIDDIDEYADYDEFFEEEE